MNQLDIFGSQVSVRFQGSQIHKINFGAFLMIILCSAILIRLGILVSSVINGRNPTVLYQERQVQDPKMFSITPNTLSLAIGVLDSSYNYQIDNSLFTIQGVYKTKKMYTIAQQSQLYMHQCIPKDMVIEIEGQFNSDSYQELNFYFNKCAGKGCKDEKEINALVINNSIKLLFTDVYFVPENKDNPFVKYSRDLYWIKSQNLPREANAFMRNNYIESDFGWITSDIKTQIYPSYSYGDGQIVDTSNGFFLYLVVRFEKEKENLYKETYDNLFTIMSQIGGFSQILLTIFSFLCLRYSQIHLARSLINYSFVFQDITGKANQGNLIFNPTYQQNIETIENQVSQNKKINQFLIPVHQKKTHFNQHLLPKLNKARETNMKSFIYKQVNDIPEIQENNQMMKKF
ncbi:hypothetical protein ABPG72_004738 [Tetrahymena utriculariae]